MRLTSLTFTARGAVFNVHGIKVGKTLIPVDQIMDSFIIDGTDGLNETWSYLFNLINDDYNGTVELTLNEKEYILTEVQWRDVYGTLSDCFIAEEMGANLNIQELAA